MATAADATTLVNTAAASQLRIKKSLRRIVSMLRRVRDCWYVRARSRSIGSAAIVPSTSPAGSARRYVPARPACSPTVVLWKRSRRRRGGPFARAFTVSTTGSGPIRPPSSVWVSVVADSHLQHGIHCDQAGTTAAVTQPATRRTFCRIAAIVRQGFLWTRERFAKELLRPC